MAIFDHSFCCQVLNWTYTTWMQPLEQILFCKNTWSSQNFHLGLVLALPGSWAPNYSWARPTWRPRQAFQEILFVFQDTTGPELLQVGLKKKYNFSKILGCHKIFGYGQQWPSRTFLLLTCFLLSRLGGQDGCFWTFFL